MHSKICTGRPPSFPPWRIKRSGAVLARLRSCPSVFPRSRFALSFPAPCRYSKFVTVSPCVDWSRQRRSFPKIPLPPRAKKPLLVPAHLRHGFFVTFTPPCHRTSVPSLSSSLALFSRRNSSHWPWHHNWTPPNSPSYHALLFSFLPSKVVPTCRLADPRLYNDLGCASASLKQPPLYMPIEFSFSPTPRLLPFKCFHLRIGGSFFHENSGRWNSRFDDLVIYSPHSHCPTRSCTPLDFHPHFFWRC